MKVTVRLLATIRDFVGSSKETFELSQGSTVKTLLENMCIRYGEAFRNYIFDPETEVIPPYIKVLVNGRDIDFLNKLQTALKDRDEITIIPPAGGG